MYQDSRRYGNVHNYDYANWGYIILYLVVILFSLAGNSVFLMTIKRNQHFRRTHHIFLAFLALRDLIVTILVVPFVIDSQVRKIESEKKDSQHFSKICMFFSITGG